jgi:hypothetical protein
MSWVSSLLQISQCVCAVTSSRTGDFIGRFSRSHSVACLHPLTLRSEKVARKQMGLLLIIPTLLNADRLLFW